MDNIHSSMDGVDAHGEERDDGEDDLRNDTDATPRFLNDHGLDCCFVLDFKGFPLWIGCVGLRKNYFFSV